MFQLCIIFVTIVAYTTCSNLEHDDYCDDGNDTAIFENNSSQILTNDDFTVTYFECFNNTKYYGCRMSALRQGGDIAYDPSYVINYGDTVIAGNFLLLCQKAFPLTNQTTFVRIGCYVDNRVLAPGQTYRNGSEYYECTSSGKPETPTLLDDDIDLRKAGCVDQYGQTAPLSSYHDVNGYRYECLVENGKFVLVPYGCLVDDMIYKINEYIVISDYWYACKRANDQLIIAPGGCIVDYGFIRIGEVFHSKGYIGRCDLVKNTIIEGTDKIDLRLIGCLSKSNNGTIVERNVDERWLEVEQKETQFSIEMACIQITSKRLMKLATRCSMPNLRSKNSEPIFIEPNCFTRINRTLWTCHKTIFGSLVSTVLENASMQDTADAIMSGMRYC